MLLILFYHRSFILYRILAMALFGVSVGCFMGWIDERTYLAAATGRVPRTTATRRVYGKTNSILLFGTTDATIVFAARLDTLFFCVWRWRIQQACGRVRCVLLLYTYGTWAVMIHDTLSFLPPFSLLLTLDS